MNETGDQFETQSMTNEFKSLDINYNEELNELIEAMKDKCESLVNNSDRDISADHTSDIEDSHLLRRDNDSEAEDAVECGSNGQTDNTKGDTRNDIINNTTNGEDNKVVVVSTEPFEKTTGLTLHGRPNRQFKPRTEKWGESVGIVDESGRVKRVISLEELHNYLILETWGQRTDSKIYSSLINERYPRFFDSTIDYLQRWRMRYNIFVDKVLADKNDNSLVHMGELHLYFDLIPKFPTPYYVNNSFYSNPNDAEKALDLDRYQKMKSAFDSIRKSQSIFQLKFPIRHYLFHSTDNVFEKFRERHHEIMEEARAVHRKGQLRKQRQKSNVPSDRDFGQSTREFHQMGRKLNRNGRKFSEIGQGFAATERQEFGEPQRGFGANRRGFGRGRNERSFNATNRKPFHPKPKNENRRRRNDSENSVDLDVTFEDTRERHERNGQKSTFGKPHKAMNRNVEQGMDAFRDKRGPNLGAKDHFNHNNNRVMDSGFRRQNRDDFKGKDNHLPSYTPATGAFFSSTEMEPNRRRNSVNSYGQPTLFGRFDV